MKTLFVLFLTFQLLLLSCVHKEEPVTKFKMWHYDNGNIKKVQEYKNDSIENGVYLFYYPNGVLQDSARIVNGRFHGDRYLFSDSGLVEKVTTYYNDRFRSGSDFRLNQTVAFYGAYNYYEEVAFLMYYDSIGNYKSSKGNLIHSWVREENYTIGEDFNIELLVANPERGETKVEVIDWDCINNKRIRENTVVPDQFNRVNYSRTQNESKDICILHIASFFDSNNKLLIRDSLMIKVDKSGKSFYGRKLNKMNQ